MIHPFELMSEQNEPIMQVQPFWNWFNKENQLEITFYEEQDKDATVYLTKQTAQQIIEVLQSFVDGKYDIR